MAFLGRVEFLITTCHKGTSRSLRAERGEVLLSSYTEAMSLGQRLARVEAYIDIQNLMSKYSFYHTANRHQDCADLFALDTEDVWAEMVWGRYCGREGILRLYPGYHAWADGDCKGKMHMHAPCSPYIEVAADCQTARGIWVAPGHETGPIAHPGNEAFWCWMKYDCDFIVEHGEWKIWHMRTPGIFMTPFAVPWTENVSVTGGEGNAGPLMPEQFRPDEPPVAPNWEYTPDSVYPQNDPEVPCRYDTWSNVQWANRDNSSAPPVSPLK